MKPNVLEAFEELVGYLESYALKKVFSKKELRDHVKSAFQKYYALLVFEHEVSTNGEWPKKKKKSAQYSLYMTEVTSDICQSHIIASQGMYKPAYLVLRSGVENFLKCLWIAQDKNVATISSVFDLIELLKKSKLIKNDSVARARFLSLRAQYAKLCGFVHTSTSHHMAMTKMVGVFPRYVDPEAKEYFKCLVEVLTDVCCLNAIVLKSSFHNLHHKHKDTIYDAMPKSVKRHLVGIG